MRKPLLKANAAGELCKSVKGLVIRISSPRALIAYFCYRNQTEVKKSQVSHFKTKTRVSCYLTTNHCAPAQARDVWQQCSSRPMMMLNFTLRQAISLLHRLAEIFLISVATFDIFCKDQLLISDVNKSVKLRTRSTISFLLCVSTHLLSHTSLSRPQLL